LNTLWLLVAGLVELAVVLMMLVAVVVLAVC
jgi:hypothetical protein